MNLETVTVCPICSGTRFEHYINTQDFTVTTESFTIERCTTCEFLLTSPRPSASDISKYYQSEKYISHSGGGNMLTDKIYLAARQLTLGWKRKLISKFHRGGVMLDYGCGTGEFLQHMSEKGWNIAGVEPSEAARQKANLLLNEKVVPSLENLRLREFDAITLWHVLEHVHTLNETIASLKHLLHQNGTLFIAVPNYESRDAKNYNSYWAAYDVPRHLWHFSKETMKTLMAKHGLTIVKIQPMLLDSFYVSLLSESYKDPSGVKPFQIVKAFSSGLMSNLSAMKTRNYSSLIYILKK